MIRELNFIRTPFWTGSDLNGCAEVNNGNSIKNKKVFFIKRLCLKNSVKIIGSNY